MTEQQEEGVVGPEAAVNGEVPIANPRVQLLDDEQEEAVVDAAQIQELRTQYTGHRIKQGKNKKKIEKLWVRARGYLMEDNQLPVGVDDATVLRVEQILTDIREILHVMEQQHGEFSLNPNYQDKHGEEHEAFMYEWTKWSQNVNVPSNVVTKRPARTEQVSDAVPDKESQQTYIQAPVGLPGVILDTFNGSLGEYQAFKRSHQIIMEGSGVKPELQAMYLRGALKGEALLALSHITHLSDLTIDELWHELDAVYDKADLDYQHHLSKLQSMAAMRPCMNNMELVGLCNYVKEHITKLRNTSKNDKAGDDFKVMLHRLL